MLKKNEIDLSILYFLNQINPYMKTTFPNDTIAILTL